MSYEAFGEERDYSFIYVVLRSDEKVSPINAFFHGGSIYVWNGESDWVYGGVMRTVLARQERMGPHAMGRACLSMQTSTAVR